MNYICSSQCQADCTSHPVQTWMARYNGLYTCEEPNIQLYQEDQ